MSTAEYTARNIYETYNLGALPQEVKRQLMIIFLNEQPVKKNDNSQDAIADLRAGAIEALQDIKTGNTYPIDDFFTEIEEKYPWLCE